MSAAQDPFASIATPVQDDPFASIAQPIKPPERTWIDSAKDLAKEWWDKVNPVTAVQGAAQAAAHPLDTGSQLLKNQGELALKAKDAFDKGNYTEGIRHFLNYMVPVLGQQTDEAGDLAQKGELAKSAGQTLGIATNIAAPELIKGANVHLPAGNLPERMYQSALKPSTTLPSSQVANMVKTGLENEIPVSAGGVQKIGDLVSDLQGKVKAQIQAGSSAGATVNPYKVASRLSDTAKKFETQVNPEADLDAVSNAGNEFLRNNPSNIPASAAQDLKSGTYKQLSSKYGELGSAVEESQKALARGIKEELENQFPEIKGLNAREGQLINLDGALQRAVKRIDNRDVFSLGGKIAAGAGAALGAETGHTAAGVIAGVVLHKALTDPMVQSKLAMALRSVSKGGMTIPAATARVTGYLNQLGNSVNATSPENAGPSNP